jgi:hypothetical protein
MQSLGITRAASTDAHFRVAGFDPLFVEGGSSP